MADTDIYVAVPDEPGWAPIRHMAELLCSYLQVKPIVVDLAASLDKKTKLLATVPRLKKGERTALVIACDPGQLNAIAQSDFILRPYRNIIGWVIDSFWVDRIPRIARSLKTYDHIYVTDPADMQDWQTAGVPSVSCLAWGADVWGNIEERVSSTKNVDLLRVGRQPEAWDDDQQTASAAAELGLIFSGRPAFGTSSSQAAQNLASSLKTAKCVLAFSNRVSPASYTHPRREYVTGRWMDALAWGCTVVGKVPATTIAEDYFWQGATLDISPQDLKLGLKTVQNYLESWSSDQAKQHISMALKNLDWRYRFAELANYMNWKIDRLENDLKAMKYYKIA
ncbi:MAG: glycosyltransferase family 1 protein [Rothia sp. (in: high G+C Gram-positive bacteria)]|nr:glycosyltransferase family 1 protein [Rothia sp. (in: high G+C Gram-positive bacteria)]